ncbi:MAG TPA: hypothetical protein VF530_14710 [Planctomycetota bacterium]
MVRRDDMPSQQEPREPGDASRARRSFLLRLSPDLLDELRGWAAQDLRSLNAHIEFLLREAARRRRGQAP